jgi:membrane-bound inhibitor of C-type lysozyme
VSYTIEGQETETPASEADYIGLSVEDAQLLASQNDVPFRVTMKDGQPLPATMDYRIGRINASVENNIVVDYSIEGQETETPAIKEDYVGLNVEDAITLAESNQVPFRVVKKDDRLQPTTRDFRIGRINATTKDDIVISYEVEGQAEAEPTTAEQTLYVCGAQKYSATFGSAEKMTLTDLMTNKTYTLEQVRAASGAKYQDAEGHIFWGKGDSAMISLDGEDNYQDCMTEALAKNTSEMTVTVSPQKRDCMGVGPMECLVVDGNNWYSDIEGFDFEAGYEYELKIKKTARPEPIPADASAFTYELIEVLAKTATE